MERTARFKCGVAECKEFGVYIYKNKKEYSGLYDSYGNGKYLCCRHTNPEENLSSTNKKTEKVYTADKSKKYPNLTGLYWNSYSGFVYGPGFKAYAKDFPKGTKLIITAEIVLPE